MILDARREVEDGAELSFDLCIVGTGPAGLTLALELAPLGIRIGVLEAGTFQVGVAQVGVHENSAREIRALKL